MNDFDWASIEAANQARALMAEKVRNGWNPQAEGSDHANCDHAHDYCANTLDNRLLQEVAS